MQTLTQQVDSGNAGRSQFRTEFFVSRGVAPEIASLDLEMVKKKLQDPDEGEGWSPEQCETLELEYKRYLHLCKKYGRGIVPTSMIDKFWHHHMLDTVAYCNDCERVFGYYLHHFPYFGMRGEQDAENLRLSFMKTQGLYEEEFGDSMTREELTKCWHDCESRCWHACKNQRWEESMESLEDLICPPPIERARISFLEARGIDSDIASLDFEMLKQKLQDSEEGVGWSHAQCEVAELEYKRFLHLCKKYEGEVLVPSRMIVTFWRYHILDTIAYHQDTQTVYGYYLHHYPYFGMGGETEQKTLLERFEHTQVLYNREFGEPMSREEVLRCFDTPLVLSPAKACARYSM